MMTAQETLLNPVAFEVFANGHTGVGMRGEYILDVCSTLESKRNMFIGSDDCDRSLSCMRRWCECRNVCITATQFAHHVRRLLLPPRGAWGVCDNGPLDTRKGMEVVNLLVKEAGGEMEASVTHSFPVLGIYG